MCRLCCADLASFERVSCSCEDEGHEVSDCRCGSRPGDPSQGKEPHSTVYVKHFITTRRSKRKKIPKSIDCINCMKLENNLNLDLQYYSVSEKTCVHLLYV